MLLRNSPAQTARLKRIGGGRIRRVAADKAGRLMRLLQTAVWLAAGISPALAQRPPVIVIPGRPDVGRVHPVRPPHTRQSRRCRASSTEGGAAIGATAPGPIEVCSAIAAKAHARWG